MSLGQRVLMVLTVEERGDGFAGTLKRPKTMTTDGYSFSGLGGGVVIASIVAASRQNAVLHLVVEHPKDRSDNDEFEMTLTTRDDAAIKAVGTPLGAWPFRRHRGAGVPVVSTDWDATRPYVIENPYTRPNAEMRTIFAEDQAARQSPDISAEQWRSIGPQDAARRERTRALLATGALRAGEDFRNAAWVFQHGSTPDDYLLAHTLALIALAQGDASAAWIAGATLDRYLQSTGKPQIYGTQFAEGSSSQEPYDRKLISDPLRRQLRVPTVADQQNEFQRLIGNQNPSATTRKDSPDRR
jgi:hypothetical protein